MSACKNVSNANDNLIQFLREKRRFLHSVGFTDEELEFFEIHFETRCIFRGNSDNLLVAANFIR